MVTPRAGGQDLGDPAEQLLAQLTVVNQAIDATDEQLKALAEQQQQITAALQGMGWQ
jgi:hypothetical protein